MKILYLSIGGFLSVLAIKIKDVKHKEKLMPLFLGSMAYCFSFWGVSTIFHTSEGYPPQWFFWVSMSPSFVSSLLLIINIEKK